MLYIKDLFPTTRASFLNSPSGKMSFFSDDNDEIGTSDRLINFIVLGSKYCCLRLNGLQVNEGGLYREFTKSLKFCDFDVLKNPFIYVHLSLLHTLFSRKKSENRHA